MGFDVYYIEKNDYTCAVFLISHECKRVWIYFSELYPKMHFFLKMFGIFE